jgi:hypothetical protein
VIPEELIFSHPLQFFFVFECVVMEESTTDTTSTAEPSNKVSPFGKWLIELDTGLTREDEGETGDSTVICKSEGAEFQPKRKHRYIIRRASDGSIFEPAYGRIMSVTKYIESLFPLFNAEQVVLKMRETTRLQKYRGLSNKEILCKWKFDGERAAELGTAMHAVIEELTNDRINKGVYIDGSSVISDIVNGDAVVVRGEHLRALFDYLDAQGMIPIAAEKALFDEEMLMAGTTDALYSKWDTGQIYLYDWKRRKEFTRFDQWNKGLPDTPAEGMSKSHLTSATFQLNIYAAILKRGEGTAVDALRVATIHPEGGVRVDEIRLDYKLMQSIVKHRREQLVTESKKVSI